MSQANHEDLLLRLTSPGGDLSTTGRYTTLQRSDWYDSHGILEPRANTLTTILDEFMANQGIVSRRAIITAGPPGAGKSSATTSVLSRRDSKDYRWIDPDRFKDLLLQKALSDGSFPSLVSREVASLQYAGSRFHLREFGSLVHSESCTLSHKAAALTRARAENLIYDTTLPTRVGASHAIKPLQKAGYRVTIISVECTRDEAIERTRDRWRAGRAAALREPSGSTSNRALGARFVPPDYIASLYPSDRPDRSHSADVARWAFDHYPAVTELQCYRVRDGEKAPELERVLHKIPDGRVIDTRPSGDELPEHVRELRRAFGPQRGTVQRPTPTGTTPARPPGANRRRPNQLER